MRKLVNMGRGAQNVLLSFFVLDIGLFALAGCRLGPENPYGAAAITALLLIFASGVGVVLTGEAFGRFGKHVARKPHVMLWTLKVQIVWSKRRLLAALERENRRLISANARGIRRLRKMKRMLRSACLA